MKQQFFPRITQLTTTLALSAALLAGGCNADGSPSDTLDDDQADAKGGNLAVAIGPPALNVERAKPDHRGWISDPEILKVSFKGNAAYTYRVLLAAAYDSRINAKRVEDQGNDCKFGQEGFDNGCFRPELEASANSKDDLVEFERNKDDISVTALLSRTTADERVEVHIEVFDGDSFVSQWNQNFDLRAGTDIPDAFPRIVEKENTTGTVATFEVPQTDQAAIDLWFETSEPVKCDGQLRGEGKLGHFSDNEFGHGCSAGLDFRGQGGTGDIESMVWDVTLTDRAGQQTTYELTTDREHVAFDHDGIDVFRKNAPLIVTLIE